MQRLGLVLPAVLVLAALAGCNKGSSDGQSAASEKPAGPDVAVFDFLKAVQTGDDDKAAGMLTKTAREKTEAMDLVVAPPGSPTASFEVGEVEMIGDNGAYVACSWTDNDEEGQKRTDQIVWVLRKEPEGWRIAGMVTTLFDEKLVLNFEDPEDMMRKQALAEQEMLRRQQQQQGQAVRPDDPNGPLRR
jgi:hypothetical protein